MRVAFIGLGNMGSGMAANQAKAGREVVAFDVSAAACAQGAELGVRIAGSVGEAVKDAQIIITMLPAGRHVREVYEREIVPNASKGALALDCSTIDVDSARAVSALASAAGLRAADAPVSGGVAAARSGALAFMVGCNEEDFASVEAALQPMARVVIRAGDFGAGQAAKICNNMLLGVSMIGVSEAFALAEKLGLDAKRFFDIASKSSGQCWSLTSYCPWPGILENAPASNGYTAGFAVAMMLKDLRLAQDAARATGATTPLGAKAEELYATFAEAGRAEQDFSAIVNDFR